MTNPSRSEIDRAAGGPPGPHPLGGLFEPAPAGATLWADAELREIFRHQLDASLALDLSRGSPLEFNVIWLEASRATPAPRTFGELFGHPKPPLALLRRVKEFAKSAQAHAEAALPPEIAAFLYHAAIAAALVRQGERITTMNDARIVEGCGTLLARDWLDAPSRVLLDSAVRLIRSAP